MLVEVLSCREGMSQSGVVARVAGETIGADRYLASMATDEFLRCLSKSGIERAAAEAGVRALPKTGKDIRAALIAHVGKGTYVLPAARFALSRAEVAGLQRRAAEDTASAIEDNPKEADPAAAEQVDGVPIDTKELGESADEEDGPGDDADLPPPWLPESPPQPAA